jgi:hypothetical protein
VRKRSKKFSMLKTILICCLPFQVVGNNDPIEENDLGIISKSCADRYCPKTQNIDIWLNMQPYCFANIETRRRLKASHQQLMQKSSSNLFSHSWVDYVSAFLCGVAAVCGFSMGLIWGERLFRKSSISQFGKTSIVNKNEYLPLPQGDFDEASSGFTDEDREWLKANYS